MYRRISRAAVSLCDPDCAATVISISAGLATTTNSSTTKSANGCRSTGFITKNKASFRSFVCSRNELGGNGSKLAVAFLETRGFSPGDAVRDEPGRDPLLHRGE